MENVNLFELINSFCPHCALLSIRQRKCRERKRKMKKRNWREDDKREWKGDRESCVLWDSFSLIWRMQSPPFSLSLSLSPLFVHLNIFLSLPRSWRGPREFYKDFTLSSTSTAGSCLFRLILIPGIKGARALPRGITRCQGTVTGVENGNRRGFHGGIFVG